MTKDKPKSIEHVTNDNCDKYMTYGSRSKSTVDKIERSEKKISNCKQVPKKIFKETT